MTASLKNKAILGEVKAKALIDADFKKKLMADPTGVLREAGANFEKDIEIKMVESTEKVRYFVLPYVEGGKLTDEALEAVAAGDSTATKCDTVQTTEAVTTEVEAAETTTTEHAEAETTVVAVAEIVAT